MTLIVDLREAASIIEADFSHLWVPQNPHCWYRSGAFEPIIDPSTGPYYIRIKGEFIPIKDFNELPDTDIYNWKGLVIPRELVSTLTNKCSQPTRGLYLVQQYLSWIVYNHIANAQYRVNHPRDWYVEKYLNPQLTDPSNVPPDPLDPEDPKNVIWNALSEHWFKITDYLQELTNLVIDYVKVNPWCDYHEHHLHHDLILERGKDRRIEFWEKYYYLHDDIQALHRKAEEEKEISRAK
jgi:hypothetical protein